jgi:hypothetical protein
MATAEAVNQASRLSEIGFPEFTAKLVTDVFDALVSANMRQTEAYISLIKEVGKSLSQYINDTKDDIGGEEIMQFLSLVAPPENADGNSADATKVKVSNTLTQADVDKINPALKIAGISENDNVAVTGTLDQAAYNKILDAVAGRIAANKYDLLKEMVKQGILRLVVEDGLIETRLTFSTYGSSFYQDKSTDYNRSNFAFKAKAKTGGLVSLWCKASASTSFNSVKISTAEKINQDRSGSRVNIFGMVQINFKTDYLPLNA